MHGCRHGLHEDNTGEAGGSSYTVNTNSCWRCLPPILRAAVPLTAIAPLGFFPVTMSRNLFSASCKAAHRRQQARPACQCHDSRRQHALSHNRWQILRSIWLVDRRPWACTKPGTQYVHISEIVANS